MYGRRLGWALGHAYHGNFAVIESEPFLAQFSGFRIFAIIINRVMLFTMFSVATRQRVFYLGIRRRSTETRKRPIAKIPVRKKFCVVQGPSGDVIVTRKRLRNSSRGP